MGLFPLGTVAQRILGPLNRPEQFQTDRTNVLIVVFDALSALNVGLYGYARETMPHLSRLAERAVVFHNHYAGGNFTSPGTASLLTGTLPWTNRAFRPLGNVYKELIDQNLFAAFPNHFRFAYTQNPWADAIIGQFTNDLEAYIPLERFMLSNDTLIKSWFSKDKEIASVSWNRIINSVDDMYAYSLFLTRLYDLYSKRREPQLAQFAELFPRGVPSYEDNYFLLEETIAGLEDLVLDAHTPFLGYLHFLPPHEPYRTHREFINYFQNDGWFPVSKPTDTFNYSLSENELFEERTYYDEFILYVDREFNKFYNYLEITGILDNTWLVITSDHGEMFERGILGHRTPTLYEPVVRVPLLIFEPGRTVRKDIYEPTSAVDLLPTMAYVTGQTSPSWAEGEILPPFSKTDSKTDRTLYVLECSTNPKRAPIEVATVALREGRYKLTYFFGYEELGDKVERVELYNVESDPEELQDLSHVEISIREEMLVKIKNKLISVNKPFM